MPVPNPKIKVRDVSGQSISPEMAALIDDLQSKGIGFTLTSATRGKKHASEHGTGHAIDLGVKSHDNHSFYKFLFGEDFDPSKKVNGEYVRPELTPEAIALFKKHNIRLIDERLSDGGAHYHLEVVNEETAKNIHEVGHDTKFHTGARQGNKDKDMYFYGYPQHTYTKNEYNQSEDYQNNIQGGADIDISTMIQGDGDTTQGTHNLVWDPQFTRKPYNELTEEEIENLTDEDKEWYMENDPATVTVTEEEEEVVTTEEEVVTTEEEEKVKAKYDTWRDLDPGAHEDGDIIQVGDDYYEYQATRNTYAPHNIETGETEDLYDHSPKLVNDSTVGINPEFLPSNEPNPNYKPEGIEYPLLNGEEMTERQKKFHDRMLRKGSIFNPETGSYFKNQEALDKYNEEQKEVIPSVGEEVIPEVTDSEPEVTDSEYPEVTQEMIDDNYSGKGTFSKNVFEEDDSYKQIQRGTFRRGKLQGQGTIEYIGYSDDGTSPTKHEGKFVNGKFVEGKTTYADGSVIEGKYERKHGNLGDSPNTHVHYTPKGKVTITNAEGDVYTGKVQAVPGEDGYFSKTGEGTIVYANGDKYEGKFVNNKKTKEGVYTYADGSSYQGEYKDGLPSGGTYTDIKGAVSGNFTEADIQDLRLNYANSIEGSKTYTTYTDQEGNIYQKDGKGEWRMKTNKSLPEDGIPDYIHDLEYSYDDEWTIIDYEPDESSLILHTGDVKKILTEGPPTTDPTHPDYISPEEQIILDEEQAVVDAEANRRAALSPEERDKEDQDHDQYPVYKDELDKMREKGIDDANLPSFTDWLAKIEEDIRIQNPEVVDRTTQEDGQVLITYDDGTTSLEQPARFHEGSFSEEQSPAFTNALNQGLSGIGNMGESLLKGAGAALDAIGGPGAIISYIMGKKGLDAAMKEIEPLSSPELSPMFMQHLRQTKELAKKGFHPDQEREFRKELDNAYQVGLENAVRGSGGQRAKFLAQSGVLDAQRSSALLEYAAKDEEIQSKNADKYEKMMLFKENFDLNKSEKERAEDMARQVADKKAAAGFASSAFANLMTNMGGDSSILEFMRRNQEREEQYSQFVNTIGNTSTEEGGE